MDVSLVSWVLVVLLLATTIALLVFHRRDRARALQSQGAEHRQRIEQEKAAHAASIQLWNDDRASAAARYHSIHRFAARRIEWELASREQIVALCTELAIDGVLATNVVFEPGDSSPSKPFVAQIDHVLLTDGAALLIESKNWRGVVFDGVRPGEIHPAFEALVPATGLNAPFAVQIVAASESGHIDVRVHTGSVSPRYQVRRQAARLAEYLGGRLEWTCWLDTSVFYSHANSQVYSDDRATRVPSGATDIIAGHAQLRERLRRLKQKPPLDRSPAAVIAPALAELGADMQGVGSYAAHWRSVLTVPGPGQH